MLSVLNFEILRISSFFAANLVGVFPLWTAKLLLTLNKASALFLIHYETKPVERNDGGDRMIALQFGAIAQGAVAKPIALPQNSPS